MAIRALRAPSRRPALAAAMVLVAGFVLQIGTGTPAQGADRPPVQPLPADLESIRATEATALYGSPDLRPLDQRRTSLITVGDSQISGEGVGNYVPGTHQDGNWCDRSFDQAVFRTAIPSDAQYNLACSGATSHHLVYGSGQRQWNELNQGDYLAIKARNTKVKLIWVVVGANGEGTIQFGPVATDCAIHRVFFLGPCYPTYTDQWTVRVEGSRQQVEMALASLKQTMRDAGYLRSEYELVLMSYASPASPDVEDNPSFPGWYGGGCLLYLHDLAFARNKAVPMFESASRRAALNQGVRYLDASRMFHGHEVCTDNTMVRGLFIEIGVWNENAARQSFHPHFRGHGAFAECMTAFYNAGLATASCVDPASTGRMSPLQWTIRVQAAAQPWHERLRGRRGIQLPQRHPGQISYPCHGGRNQGFWYDQTRQSLHVELSHDRCLDVSQSNFAAGTTVNIYDCNATFAQRWVFAGGQLKPAVAQGLCLAFDNPLFGKPRLRLATCGSSSRQQWSFESRSFPNPVGYGHDDFIGSRVY